MWEWIKVLLLGIFLAWQAIEDYYKKSIRMDIVLIFGGMGIFVYFLSQGIQISVIKELLVSCLPGVLLMVISHICPGTIGDGDGLVFLVTGIYMGLAKNGILIYLSFLLVSMVGGLMFFLPKRKKRASCYPFVPYIFSAFILIEIWGMRI